MSHPPIHVHISVYYGFWIKASPNVGRNESIRMSPGPPCMCVFMPALISILRWISGSSYHRTSDFFSGQISTWKCGLLPLCLKNRAKNRQIAERLHIGASTVLAIPPKP